MIDWDVAVATGVRWARPGPQVSLAEARRCVAELRELANTVHEPVQQVSGLVSPETSGRIAVVDRPGWIRANVDGFRVVLEPLVQHLREHQEGRLPAFAAPGSLLGSVGPRVTGMQVGLILAYLAGRVLGQYELFLPPEPGTAAAPFGPPAPAGDGPDGTAGNGAAPDGRLTLVAPNILMVERELDVNPHDFRLWVCLHEETHRVQFTAVPWMRDHLMSEIRAISETLEPASIIEGGVERILEAVRAGRAGGSIVDMFSTPEQREILDRVTGMMSLLEGHADVVMDDVGPTVIPSVKDIRTKFTKRRQGVGTLDRVLRRLLGLEAKMAQYRDGATFVRGVVDKVGMEQFNAVWAEPANLPAKAELGDPDAWIARVLS